MTKPEMESKEPVQHEVYPIEMTNEHRQMAFVERIKSRREHLYPGVTGQPDGIECSAPAVCGVAEAVKRPC